MVNPCLLSISLHNSTKNNSHNNSWKYNNEVGLPDAFITTHLSIICLKIHDCRLNQVCSGFFPLHIYENVAVTRLAGVWFLSIININWAQPPWARDQSIMWWSRPSHLNIKELMVKPGRTRLCCLWDEGCSSNGRPVFSLIFNTFTAIDEIFRQLYS
jgi:hypothetical protein